MRAIIFCLGFIFCFGCKPAPKPIEYGSDICHFCKMSIVDARFGAEAVTDKGKVFTFDAIECMVQYTQQEEGPFAHLVVNTFETPKDLFPVESCTFLISPEIPSPMGAYLSAFTNTEAANQKLAKHGGVLYNWGELAEALQNR